MFKTGKQGRLWPLSPGCRPTRQSATISGRQLTPVTYNHRLRLAAVRVRTDASAVTQARMYQFLITVGPLFNESIKPRPLLLLLPPFGSMLHIRGEKSEGPRQNVGQLINRPALN